VHPIPLDAEAGDTTIKARIWTETTGVVARMEVSSSSEISGSDGDVNTVAANVTLTEAGWNEVTFDFGQPVSRFVGALGTESVVELNADTTYNVLTMFVDYENGLDAEDAAVGTPVTEETVYYIDDIRVGFGDPEYYVGADPEPGSDRQLFSAVRAAKDLKSQFAGVEDFGSGSTFDFEATDPNEVYDRVFSVTSGEEFGVNVGFVAFPVLGEGFAEGYEAFRFKASVPEIVEGIEIKLIGGSKESAAVIDGTFPGVTDLGNGWYDVIVPLSEFSYSSAIPSHTGYLIGAPGDYGTEQITLYFTDIKLEGTADNYPTSLSELVAEQSTDGSGDSSDSSAGSGLLGEFGGINFETPDGMSSSDYITDAFEGASVSIATDPTDADN